jgi:hypothetical protein
MAFTLDFFSIAVPYSNLTCYYSLFNVRCPHGKLEAVRGITVLRTTDPRLSSGSTAYLWYDLGQVAYNLCLTLLIVRIIRPTSHLPQT